MKVEFNAGDMCAIPDGCKATIKDGVVIFEEEVQEFKNGDMLCSVLTNTIVIFKKEEGYDNKYFCSHYTTDHYNNNKGWNKDAFRHATEEEKQTLFDKMKEQGLRWNAEEKRVEKVRWRAGVGEDFYFINSSLDVLKINECWSVLCEELYSVGNYFRTKEQAEEAAKRVKKLLYNYHEEIGE